MNELELADFVDATAFLRLEQIDDPTPWVIVECKGATQAEVDVMNAEFTRRDLDAILVVMTEHRYVTENVAASFEWAPWRILLHLSPDDPRTPRPKDR